jgi:phosphoribosylglycinamide formyltransferase 1
LKAVICTSNGIRHKFFANSITSVIDETLIISESNTNDANQLTTNDDSSIIEHFNLRHQTEMETFQNSDYFYGNVVPLIYREINLKYTFDIIKKFNPDVMLVFGSSIIKEPLLSLLPNKIINLHLGLSPYYRGSGTNFWPFINKELEYIGSTILKIDSGIDTGDIISHVRPKIEINDNVHTIGCKVIQESISVILQILKKIENGSEIFTTKQWNVNNEKYYKNKDFTAEILAQYKKNLKNGLVNEYIKNPIVLEKLISLK